MGLGHATTRFSFQNTITLILKKCTLCNPFFTSRYVFLNYVIDFSNTGVFYPATYTSVQTPVVVVFQKLAGGDLSANVLAS